MRWLLIPLLLILTLSMDVLKAEEQTLYIASRGKEGGIYRCKLNVKTGELSEPERIVKDVQTGFLALHPTQPVLYAAAVLREKPKGKPTGSAEAFAIDASTGDLTRINFAPSGDNGTTHIEVSNNGKFAAICHYGGKGTTLFHLKKNGALKQNISQIAHEGSSVHPRRQTRPHPHGVAFSQDARFLCVADLGNDRVEVFAISKEGTLKSHSHWKANGGAGPRHVSFHPNGKWLYCINELDSTLSVLEFDSKKGTLKELETVTTLPSDYPEANSTAEVIVHPSGKFVYGSNRGHNSTAVFSIDEKSGRLGFVEREPTQGDHPRFVGLDPTGQIYLATNMNSDNMVTFRIDQNTGALRPTGFQVKVPKPMSVVFVK